jgi:glucose/arabinose dehydrogenase
MDAVRVRLTAACVAAALGCALVASVAWSSSPLGSTVSVRLTVPAANRSGVFSQARSLTIPRGWSVEVWALVSGARFMAWTPQGSLLVSNPYNGSITELTPGSNRAAPPKEQVILSRLTMPQGMAFDTVAGRAVLYVAESNEIDRYLWRGSAGVGARTVIVHALPDTDPKGDDVHRLKTLTVGPDHRLYVNIGSAYNASPQDIAGNPPRASVVSYAPSGGGAKVVASGIRNAEGLAFAPNGVLWASVNERDNIAYPFHGSYGSDANAYGHTIQAYINNHPPDEVVALTPGRNLGWPYCNPDPAHGTANMAWDDDEQNNAGGKVFNCSKLTPINRGIPAHSAPLGMSFLEGSKLPASLAAGAVIAVHGSWNRQPPRAPAVLWLPWSHSTLGAPLTLVGGFQAGNGSRFGRPVDAVAGPDGSLYISDDQAGAIYRLTP